MPHDEEDFFEALAADEEPEYSDEEEFGQDYDEAIAREVLELGEDWERDHALDTTEVRLEDPDAKPRPGDPPWVVRGDCVEEELGIIKTGKEADVTLVRRTTPDGARSCLLACKTYRPREQRAFRREEEYREGQSLGDERVDRAVKRRSRFGRSILEYAWAYREYPLVKTAWDAGVRVPYPVEARQEAFYMQYIGDAERAAPRLAEVKLDRATAERAYEDLARSMRLMLDEYLVHSDLSAYNVLWWEDQPWIIDFPQAVDVAKSSRGLEFLRRDCENVCRWFSRKGVACDSADLYWDLLRHAPFAEPLAHDGRADLELAAMSVIGRPRKSRGPRRLR